MKSWFLIMHNLDGARYEQAQRKLVNLGVEVYSPTITELKPRSDGYKRPTEKKLFPGYLFVKFNPEEVHTTTVSDMHGMKGFVRIGNDRLATASETLIQALKQSLLLRVDKGANCLEFRNFPVSVQNQLVEIAAMPKAILREIALMKLLQSLSTTIDNLSIPSIVSNG